MTCHASPRNGATGSKVYLTPKSSHFYSYKLRGNRGRDLFCQAQPCSHSFQTVHLMTLPSNPHPQSTAPHASSSPCRHPVLLTGSPLSVLCNTSRPLLSFSPLPTGLPSTKISTWETYFSFPAKCQLHSLTWGAILGVPVINTLPPYPSTAVCHCPFRAFLLH